MNRERIIEESTVVSRTHLALCTCALCRASEGDEDAIAEVRAMLLLAMLRHSDSN